MDTGRPPVIVTGSSGLIGHSVCRRLVDHGHRIVGIDKDPPDEPIDGVEFHEVDLTNADSVSAVVRRAGERHGGRFASVVHLAAYYDFSGEPSPLYEEVTVQGTGRLLTAVKHLDVEQFLFTSTMLVHAPTEPGKPITEDSPIEAKWDYPQSKVRTEELIRCEHGDIPAVLLRVAGVYNDRGHSIPITQQIKRIHERQITSHVFPGDTSHGQAFVHLDDVVEAIALCVEKRTSLPEWLPLLIGEDETPSYDELQRLIARLIHGEGWDTRQIPKAMAKAGAWVQDKVPVGEDPFIKPWMIDLADDHYELNIGRAMRTIGWTPRHTLRETLPRMIELLKSDPDAFYRENKLGDPPKGRRQEQTADQD